MPASDSSSQKKKPRRSPAQPAQASLKVVGIGASAGGLEAFTELLRNLPTRSVFGYVLVQHLDPTHRSLLSELLGRSASLPVREIVDGTRVEADQIYVIPPNCDLTIEGGVLKLSPRDKNAGPSRSIDHFLKSLAVDQGANAIGVILSGAGSDGALGLKAIKEAGGLTFAQDFGSSKYDSMPRSAINTGCVDFVLPPPRIAAELARAVAKPGRTRSRAAANARNRSGKVSRAKSPLLAEADPGGAAEWPAAPRDADLRKIFLLLRTKTALDFSLYRINTIRRRLKRRMTLHKLDDLAAYLRFVRENPAEIEAVYQDLLINVTSFFRNPGIFDTLKRKVFPKLVKTRDEGEALRFWVAGCSTGQEAYTYAMAFVEFCEETSTHVPLQIFATDVNAQVLEKARAGRYLKTQLEGLSGARTQRFFKREGDGYRVQKEIRDRVIFAQQNLLVDPPFTRVDLISCRNLLIYIEPALQQKIIPTFHYALHPHGCLVLGNSESIGSFTTLFAPLQKTQKIFFKKPAAARSRPERLPLPPTLPPVSQTGTVPRRESAEAGVADAYREADRLTLARYSPPAVLVSEDGEILQFRGKVQPYLRIPAGKATLNLLKMAHASLVLPLQHALHRARAENKPVRESPVWLESPRQAVDIEIAPIKGLQSRCFLVFFEKQVAAPRPPAASVEPPPGRGDSRRLAELRRDYLAARERLEAMREQHETAVEELQASNEEVQSTNEELQSLNEELETSNEELESANEELTTLNEELATRNVELRESEQRLREQAQLIELAPLLVRSPKDRIIFWNRGAEVLFGFTKDEALNQSSHLLLRTRFPEPLEKIQRYFEKHGRWGGEVVHRRKDGTEITVATQWVVNHDEHGRVRAVLEVNTDVSARKKAEEALRAVRELNERILESTPDCMMVLDLAGRLSYLSGGGQRALERGDFRGETGSHWTALWSGDSRAAAETAYRGALAGDTTRFQGIAETRQGAIRWWDVVMQPILDRSGRAEQLLAVCRDVTERKQAELAAMEEAKLAALRADIAVEITRGGDILPILQQVTQIVFHHAEAASVRIWLVQENSTLLKLAATAGHLAQFTPDQSQFLIGEGRVGAIASAKRPHITHQVSADPDICDPEWARREGLTSFAGFPLLFESRLLGVMTVLSRRRLEPRLLRELGLASDALGLLIQRKHADDERARLLQQATESRNAAIAASRAKDDFLATLSHELRTPLNPVLLLASDGAENPMLPPQVRSIFETIRNNVSLEAKLIDDLLDLTRIARGKFALELKPIDVNTILRDAVRTVSATGGGDPVNFVVRLEASPAVVLGDPVRLQQVFWNILNNAVKFTAAGGRITVRSESLKNRRLRIQISDTGIGLEKGDLDRIFDAFAQVERRKGGLGLGLAISRQLLDAHRGTIRALSEGAGQGTLFEIELPLLEAAERRARAGREVARVEQAPAPHGNGETAGGTPARRRRLLLVEDHDSTRTALCALLAKRNFDVVAASSVGEARRLMGEGRYDLVISDLGLPDGDGHQLIAALREQAPDLVAIALSGYGTESDRARSRAAGFASHLTKPVSITALNRAIAEALPPVPEAEPARP